VTAARADGALDAISCVRSLTTTNMMFATPTPATMR